MHQYKLIIFLIILLLALQVKGQQQDGSVFERRVTISYKNQAIEHILEQISWQAGVYFSYDATSIDPARHVSINVENKSLYHVLNQLFNPEKFTLRERETQIIITKNAPKNNDVVAKKDTIPVKYFFLKGKIIEERRDNPIAYASVSVLNKPIGTISNKDGDFLLKLHPDRIRDTVVISCMGYAQIVLPAYKLLDEDLFVMRTIAIRIKEVQVTSVSVERILHNIKENMPKNYSTETKLLTAFYRETVKQDENYINVSEAVIDILKAPYNNALKSDLVKLVKGRKSPDVQPFRWLNFKLQGGPFTITQLDVMKTVESFIDEEFRHQYKYEISRVIWYNGEPVYVVGFEPVSEDVFPGFIGAMYVHRESFAIVHASFRFNRGSLREATNIMIKKKPRGVRARPSYVQYHVNYQQFQGKWYLSTAQASVKFKIRSKRDKLNSEFHSVSDLLITDIKPSELRRFPSDERFGRHDVFVENLGDFDEKFWGNYNIIRPDEDLRKAFKEEN